VSQATDSFLSAFFGDGNDLTLETLTHSNPALAEWLNERITVLRREPRAPALLPRRQGSAVTWYGLAHSSRDRRELVQVLYSFVGPTYGSVRIDRPLDLSDPVDAAAQEFADHAFTVDVLRGEQAEVRRALDIFFELEEIRPRRQVSVSRPLGRLLREFEMAVVAGAGHLSAGLLAEIDSAGHLSAQNIVFLRVRRLVGLRQFRTVMDLPELATIMSIRRPARVTAALFDALYVTELAGFEANGDPAAALRHFRERVLPRYAPLFRSRQGVQSASAIKIYALYAATTNSDDQHLISHLAASDDLLPSERSYVEAIVQLVAPPKASEATLAIAIEASRTGSFDAALEVVRELAPTAERAEFLIRCAIEIDSLDAMIVAKQAIMDLSDADRVRIISSRLYAAPWDRIERIVGGEEGRTAPTSWRDWFVLAASPSRFDNALEVADRSVVEWTSEALTPGDSRAISRILNQDLSVASIRRIKDALPHLLQFIDRVTEPTQHRLLLDDLSTLLLLDEDPSVADLAVLVTLVGFLFELGLSAERRRELVDDFTALYARVDAPAYLDAAIDMLDIVLTFAAGDDLARDATLSTTLAALRRWRRRVRRDQWLIVLDLANEGGAADEVRRLMPDAAEGLEEAGVFSPETLRGKTVAIYTLTEPAAVRARDFLVRNFDGIVVSLSSDHVATDRLAALAHSADIFVVATRSAKHAATTFIESQRPLTRPPVYASGKGSVSLVRAVLEAL
jgi:hypothetical protein